MRRFIGLLLLVLAVAGVGLYAYLAQRPNALATLPALPALPTLPWQSRYEPLTLRGFVSSDKLALLRDPQVQSLLKNRYNLTLNYSSAGSLEMVTAGVNGVDFLWPSSQFALELYRKQNQPLVAEQSAFTSPLVLYSWAPVAEALEREGSVRRADGGYYVVDLSRLTQRVVAESTWQELGLPQFIGKVRIATADPARSGSGSLFAGLFAMTLNGGAMIDESALTRHQPVLAAFFARQGMMPRTSANLFEQYLKQGPGAYPLVVGYESQIVSYVTQNPASQATILEQTRVLYLQPTALASHPLIAVQPGAARLLEAMADPDLQRLAWTRHGFRTGLGGAGGTETAPVAELEPTAHYGICLATTQRCGYGKDRRRPGPLTAGG